MKKGPSLEPRELFWLILPIATSFYLLYSLLIYALPQLSSNAAFALIGPQRVAGYYDMKWLLSFAACGADPQQLATQSIECLGYKYSSFYPTLSMQLARWLGLGPNTAGWIGLLAGLGVMAVIAHACWLCTRKIRSWSIITSLLLLTFPLQLLLERGNLDSILLILMALFSLIIWLPGRSAMLGANALIAITIAMKIYPVLGGGAAVLMLTKSRLEANRKLWLTFSLLATMAAALLYARATTYAGLPQSSGELRSHGLLAFGYLNSLLIDQLGRSLGRIAIYGLYIIKGLCLLLGFLGGLLFGTHQVLPIPESRQANTLARKYFASLALIFSAMGIGAYILSVGYDYRLAFLLPAVALIASNVLDNKNMPVFNRLFLSLQLLAGTYVLFLPLVLIAPVFSTSLPVATLAELVDEMVMAPFFLAGVAGIWLNLLLPFSSLPAPAGKPALA